MEGQARNHLMDIRNACLSILISPSQSPIDIRRDASGDSVALTESQALTFLQTLLDEFGVFQETVKNSAKFMQELVR